MDLLTQEKTSWALGLIRKAQDSISLMARIREHCREDWEIEELCREIIFEEENFIRTLGKEIQDGRETPEEFEGVFGGGSDHIIDGDAAVDERPTRNPDQSEGQYSLFGPGG